MHLKIILETRGYIRRVHIHFQIQQGKSFLLSASLPILFDKIKNHTENDRSYIRAGDIVENGK